MPVKGPYPTIIPFATVFQADDGFKNAHSGVIRTKTELQSILPRQSSYLANSVNFEKEQLIFVALGERNSGGYELQINAVLYLTDRLRGLPPLAEVSYKELTPGGPATEPLTYPMQVIKLKKLEGVTTFNKN